MNSNFKKRINSVEGMITNMPGRQCGFTLVELMIAMAIAGIVVASIYSAFVSQQRSYLAQEQVAEMQQSIRSGLDMMIREIRMAGYDPGAASGAKILTAQPGQMSFTMDLNGDGDTTDTGERIDFGFSPVVGADADRDGLSDTITNGVVDVLPLGRQTNGAGGYQPMAENIQAIEFRYLDEKGDVTAVLSNIRTVQISILARAGQPDQDFINNSVYTPASGVPWDLNGAAAGSAANDNFRRRLLITTVQLRNMGLL